jgi:hypothetical protein
MMNRKAGAALAVMLVLVLAMPAAVGAKKPPYEFEATHNAWIVGDDLSAEPQLVRQDKRGTLIHGDPVEWSYTATIDDSFFVACWEACPPAGTHTGHLSIRSEDRGETWIMRFGFPPIADEWYYFEAVGTLDQVSKWEAFTFTPTAPAEIWNGSVYPYVHIGTGTMDFVVEGEPIP